MNNEQPTGGRELERVLLPAGEEYQTAQRQVDRMQIAEWVQGLAPWQVFATLTFRGEASMHKAKAFYEEFMGQYLAHVPYFYVLEGNPNRGGFHVHALWAGTDTVRRKAIWEKWFNRFGRARIEPIRGTNNVASYASKYLCKEAMDCGYWNYKLEGLKGLRGL